MSFLVLIYFLIMGSSIAPSETSEHSFRFHTLRFLSASRRSVLQWGATTSVGARNLVADSESLSPDSDVHAGAVSVDVKMASNAFPEGELRDPLELSATKTCIPYAALLVVAVLAYLVRAHPREEGAHKRRPIGIHALRVPTCHLFVARVGTGYFSGRSKGPTRTLLAVHGGVPL